MAYSDYGGYAYRNGVRVEERSDFTVTPDGGFGTPGVYPAFGLLAQGATHAEAMKAAERPYYHAALGDGPLIVGLYKQSTVVPHRLPTVEAVEWLMPEVHPDRVKEWTDKDGTLHRYLDYPHAFTRDVTPTGAEIDGHLLEVFWRETDNVYVFARLTQPDGTIWHGFSGYGVGAGLEDCGYGYSTPDVEALLWELFPRPAENNAGVRAISEQGSPSRDAPFLLTGEGEGESVSVADIALTPKRSSTNSEEVGEE